MKKLVLEIPYPETIPVSAPMTWAIKYVGVYDDMGKINLIKRIIEWFKNPRFDGQYIIDCGAPFTEIVIDGLINRFDDRYNGDYHLRGDIHSFLQSYRTMSGLSLDNYVVEHTVETNGEHIGIVGKTFVYKDQDDLVSTLVHNFTLRSFGTNEMFAYKIIDDK